MRSTLVLAFCAAVAGSGCSLNKFTVDSTAPVIKAGSRALDEESDVQFARLAAPASLKTVEGFLVTSPDNPDLLETAAKGYTEYTFGFVEDDIESLPENDGAERQRLVVRATDFYDRAHGYALRLAARTDSGIGEAMEGDAATLEKRLDARFDDRDEAPGLYWLGLSTGSAINLNKDDMNRVADLPKAVALLERAHRLAPAYANYGAALALGTVYASQGKAMGGDPARAKKMFEECIAGTGGRFLMARVLYARYYATQVQDRPLFEETLRQVLETPASVNPETRLPNELAKKRAARYLARADEWFLPPEPVGAE